MIEEKEHGNPNGVSSATKQIGVNVTSSRNGKGCDIGYALTVCSRERAYSVDARTVAALEVITAFAVPNPNGSL